MIADAPLLSELEILVKHGSRGRRAELLKGLTNLFVGRAADFTEEHVQLFDDVFNRLVAEIEENARFELSSSLARLANAPPRIVRRLAQDDDSSVAGPVLQYSERLEDPDLLDVARSKSQGHLLAISNRNQIAEMITDVLVRRGDREVVRNVAENKGALFSHAGFSILIRKADRDGILAEKVGQRADIPQVLFRELFLHATQIVQKRLVATAGPETQAKIRRVLAEISNQLGINATPPDYSAAQHVVEKIRREDKLDEAAIVNLASAGRYEETVAALSQVCKIPIEVMHRTMADKRADSILVVCKAAGFAWPTAQAVVLLRRKGHGMSSHSLQSNQRIFEKLSSAAAQDVIRLWQRSQSNGQ